MKPLLKIENLKKQFAVKRKRFFAVDDVSFSMDEGEILGLVGESGSGKSTLARSAIRLIEPTEGEIYFQGEDFRKLKGRALREARQKVQMVFQDPLSSLNPRKTILDNIGEALLYHKLVENKEEQITAVENIVQQIGMPPTILDQYPHQFSGGQQQRISIGRAIAMRPKLVVCDEAVSALDLSVQAQILNLLYKLKQRFKLSYLFISHDLGVVRYFCDRILVMYRGKIVESGTSAELFENPQHPYTQQLISSIPRSTPEEKITSTLSL
ncbi:MAG: Oligopeptide transport ATP-binding protein OppF [Chlamydiales bacterium]|nr:Oligopeptide transport ATP-binding protein OppF [Chlamydiales bacterium]MCH9636216.1 Oligopeptide transport ATP-binding protein OppF [Chlamydiales bacterium]